MKIERDKWYLRRDGERERVICTDKPGSRPIVSYDEAGRVMHYYPSGACHQSGPTSGLDLVAPARAPVRGYVVVTASNHALSPVCPNLEAAEDMAAMNPHSRILDLSTAKEVGDAS